MRIVITGASRNSGSATLRGPATEGGHQIVGIARRGRETRPDGADDEWVTAHLTRGTCSGTLERVFKGANAVLHLAGGLQPSHDLRYHERLGGVSTLPERARGRRQAALERPRGCRRGQLDQADTAHHRGPTLDGERAAATRVARTHPRAVVRVGERCGQPPVRRKNRDMVENVADAIARKVERRWAAFNLAADRVGRRVRP